MSVCPGRYPSIMDRGNQATSSSRERGKPRRAETADAGPGEGMARLTFKLEIQPGGPMAPMVGAMMQPAMLPAAEDLANKIMGRVEELHQRA